MTCHSIKQIKILRKETRGLKNQWFYADSEGIQMAFMSPETLDVTISFDELTSYVNDSEHKLDMRERKFNQILSHEAFHVYQALNSPLLAEYSLTERRVSLQKFRVLKELVKLGDSEFQEELPIILDFHVDDFRSYAHQIAHDNKIASEKIYGNPQKEKFSIIDIIEGAAVCYQYLANEDFEGEVIKFDSPEYTSAWNYFYNKTRGDVENCRIVFLFMCDIYIKFLGKNHSVAEDFYSYIQLSIPQVDKIPQYKDEFFLGKDINSHFLSGLKTIHLTKLEVDIMLNFTSSLPYENQAKLYIYMRVYIELFKSLTLAGSIEKRSINNKHISIRRSLEKTTPYWKTDLILPCTLCSNYEITKFSSNLCDIGNVSYIDDFGRDKITQNSEEVKIINFIKRVEPIVCGENIDIFCCLKHGFKRRRKILKCTEPNSLNSEFKDNFNMTLSEFLNE